MPRKRRCSSPFDPFDDDFDEDASSQSSKNGQPPVQRNAANARERARMRVLSSAFGRLKTKLPNIPPDTKLSKLDTLRLATMYIRQLKNIVEGGVPSGENFDAGLVMEQSSIFGFPSGTQGMTWPFGFHHIQSNTRQLQFQYSNMDWSQPTEPPYAKLTSQRRNNDNYAQLSSNAHQTNLWYMNGANADLSSSNGCVYETLNTPQQNQRIIQQAQQQQQQHSLHLHHTHITSHHQQNQQSHLQHQQQTSIR